MCLIGIEMATIGEKNQCTLFEFVDEYLCSLDRQIPAVFIFILRGGGVGVIFPCFGTICVVAAIERIFI